MFNTPEYYRLSWNSQIPAIEIFVHQDIAREITAKRKMHKIVALQEMFGFGEFFDGLTTGLGFGKCISFHSIANGCFRYIIALPDIKENTEPCGYCGGQSGKPCFFCNSAGRQKAARPLRTYAIVASLSVLFQIISYPKVEIETPSQQLMQISTATNIEINEGFSMGGWIGGDLQNFLSAQARFSEKQLLHDTMKMAYGHMLGHEEFNEHNYRVSIDEDGGLHFSCPGSGCGINPSHSSNIKKNSGYEFQSHNMDNPFQQLTIIAALAQLCSMANAHI